jgi:hypothetical protein
MIETTATRSSGVCLHDALPGGCKPRSRPGNSEQ